MSDMSKQSAASGILVLVVILMIVISTFMAINYTTGVLNAAVAFASSDQIGKLQACGVTPPAELFKLKADVPTFLLPAIYVGLPGIMVIIAMLMFMAGYYYASGREDRSSSETTTTTSSPNRSHNSGRYQSGRHVERTQTRESSRHGRA